MLIDRLVPDWRARFFDEEFRSPFAVLREVVKQHGAKQPQLDSDRMATAWSL
jgi:hypothetical protein